MPTYQTAVPQGRAHTANPWDNDPIVGDTPARGPWEKYQQPQAAPATGPWTQYQQSDGTRLHKIELALRAADAAGNAEDARRLAQAYAEERDSQARTQGGSSAQASRANPWDGDEIIAPAPAPVMHRADFGNVVGGSNSTEAPQARGVDYSGPLLAPSVSAHGAAPAPSLDTINARNRASQGSSEAMARQRAFEQSQAEAKRRDFQSQPALMRAAVGAGSRVAAAGRGAGQLAAGAADLVSPRERQLANLITGAPASRYDEAMAHEAQVRRDDAYMQGDNAALLGGIAADVAMLYAPGGAVNKLATLPRRLAGGAALGGLYSGVQPVTPEESRSVNAFIGAGAGFGGELAGSALQAAARRIGTGLTRTERRAGQVLQREAADPSAIVATESAVPGVRRTLGEATMDPGLMALENTVRAGNRAAFDPIDTANNAARVAQLERISGTDANLAAAEAARDASTEAIRNRAFAEAARTASARQQQQALMVPTANGLGALRQRVGALASSSAGRPSVQSAVRDVTRALDNAGDSLGSLYNVRQYIGDLLGGKAGADKSYAKAASRELLEIRELLDAELAARAPSFPEYLDAYRAASKPINRMQVGREVLQRGSAPVPDEAGMPRITPGAFSRVTNDLDATAAKATQFKKAKASEILGAEDISAIKAIQDDMQRQFRRQSSAAAGSQTFERNEVGRRVALQGAARAIPLVREVAEFFEDRANERLKERLAYLIANPAEARRVLKTLDPASQGVVRKALGQLATGSSATAIGGSRAMVDAVKGDAHADAQGR